MKHLTHNFLKIHSNHLNPLFNKMICYTDLFSAAWKAMSESKTGLSSLVSTEGKKQKDAKRMVFGERLGKS